MNNKLNIFIELSFLLYFVILIVERALSVILSVTNGINLFANGYNVFTYLTVFISISTFLIYFLLRCRDIFNFKIENPNYNDLCIASGILLLSGMVHTEFTIPGIQFASYGILIIGILLRVIQVNKTSKNRLLLWFSFIYLVSFSMAIPVTYPSNMESHVFFHIFEGITSYLLVGVFTCLMIMIFKGKENLFYFAHFIIMLILDTVLIAWRWNEEINMFVLIFASLTTLLFVIGTILKAKKK